MKIKDNAIKMAAQVSRFMMDLHLVDKNRYGEASIKCLPFGDLAYGSALVDWIQKGKPQNAWFSWAEGQEECPLTMAFREEISKEFGLPILTKEEAKERRKLTNKKMITKKVFDWGNN